MYPFRCSLEEIILRTGLRDCRSRFRGLIVAAGLIVSTLPSCLVAGLYAQDSAPRFQPYPLSNGLNSSSVTAVQQDRDGFIWIGTGSGLTRLDGQGILYRHDASDPASLSDSWITALAADPGGDLWIGTRNGGLNRFDRETRTFTRYPYGAAEGAQSLQNGAVSSLLLDRDGTLWIGTAGGLSRLNPETGTFSHYGRALEEGGGSAAPLRSTVWCLYEDRTGDLWIGTWARGLSRLDKNSGTVQHYWSDPDDPHTLSSNRIRSIYEDAEEQLWIGTSGGGLNRLDPRSGRVTRYLPSADDPHSLSHSTVWAVSEDSRGTIWAGTFGGGLNRFEPRTGTFTHYRQTPSGLPGDIILSIFEDRSGLLWFATDSGVATLLTAGQHITRFEHDPAQAGSLCYDDVLSVHASARTPGTVWVGTNRGGLCRLDQETGTFEAFRHEASPLGSLEQEVVSALYEDAAGRVWIGTMGGGLGVYDPHTGAFTRYRHDPEDPTSLSDDFILALLVDRAGMLWVGTEEGGLDRLDPGNGVFQHHTHRPEDPTSIGDNTVTALLESTDGFIWAGTTDGGLSRYDPETGRFARYEHVPGDARSLSHNRVYAIHEDRTGALWVGTRNGLNRLDRSRAAFAHFTERDGLPGNIIYGITRGQGDALWIATNRGLSRLDPRSRRVTNYRLSDGFRGTHFSPGTLIRSKRGEVLVGASDGLILFRPQELQLKAYRPPLLVTGFRKFGALTRTDLRNGTPVRLSYDDRHFSFEFALLDYTDPSEHTFRYKLDGFDADWKEVSGPHGNAHYVNEERRAGSFLLRIQGTDSKGLQRTIALPVTIIPPWWRTRWFKFASLLGSLLAVSATFVYGHRRREQERAEKRRMLSEGREQERHFLARELHDVPLQNLFSVRHKLELLTRATAEGDPAEQMAEAQRVLEQTAQDLRRICGELRPPTLGPFGLSKAIRAHLRTFERSHPEIRVRFDLDPDGQRLQEQTRLALFRVYQGALSNVARHANARHVRVRFAIDECQAVLEVQDDGRGFIVPRSWLELARHKHYGLLGIAEWAEAASGHLTVKSTPGEGSLVAVVVPLKRTRRLRSPSAALAWLRDLRRRRSGAEEES